MNLNELIPIQNEKTQRVEDYKKTHKPVSQLTKDTYRALSFAHTTMLNLQTVEHNGKIIREDQWVRLSQAMSHSQELYNKWLQSTMSPPHTKSNETVPKIHESIIKGWLNQLHQYNIQMIDYTNKQRNVYDDVTRQLLLFIRNTIYQLDYYHEVSQKNPTNITDLNIRHMQDMYAEANARHQKWRSTMGLSIPPTKQNMNVVPAHNRNPAMQHPNVRMHPPPPPRHVPQQNQNIYSVPAQHYNPHSHALAGHRAALHHHAMQYHDVRMHQTPPHRQSGLHLHQIQPPRQQDLQMHQIQPPRPRGLNVVNPQSGVFHLNPNPYLHHHHQMNPHHRPPGILPVYQPNPQVNRSTGVFHAHPPNHPQQQVRFSPHRPFTQKDKDLKDRQNYGPHIHDRSNDTITGVDPREAEQMHTPTSPGIGTTIIPVPATVSPHPAQNTHRLPYNYMTPDQAHIYGGAPRNVTNPSVVNNVTPKSLPVRHQEKPRDGIDGVDGMYGAQMNPYTIDTISE